MSYLQLIRAFFRLLFPFFIKDKKTILAFLGSLFITIVDILATAWMIFYFKELADWQGNKPEAVLIALAASWLTCLLIVRIANRLRRILFFRVTNGAIRDIREKLLQHLHQTSLATWGQKHSTSSIINSSKRISSSVRSFMDIMFIKGIPTLCKLSTLVIAMACWHHAAIFFLLPISLSLLITYYNCKQFLASRKRAWQASDTVFLKMQESLYSTSQVRLQRKQADEEIKTVLDQEAAAWWRNHLDQHSIFLGQALLCWLGIAAMTSYIIWGKLYHQWDLALLLIMKGYGFAIYQSIGFLTRQLRKLLACMIDLKKIIEVFEIPIEQRSHAATYDFLSTKQPLITVDNVTFSFPNTRNPILQHVSLSIQKGDKVGIIGLSGAGKSSLCHLFAGLYLPTKGNITINGISTKALNPAAIGKYLHFIPQEATLPTTTVQHSAPPSYAAIPSLNTSRLHKRSLGENGSHISRGEKQRILLTHSLAKKPGIMLLDETLSSIDEDSAQEILSGILDQVPTVLLVSHRISLMRQLDKVYKMENGQLHLITEGSLANNSSLAL